MRTILKIIVCVFLHKQNLEIDLPAVIKGIPRSTIGIFKIAQKEKKRRILRLDCQCSIEGNAALSNFRRIF
jgi:hypothetical protein